MCHSVNYIFWNQCSLFPISRNVFTPRNVENTPHSFSIKYEVYGFLFVSSYLNKFWGFFCLYRVQYHVIFECDMSRVHSEMMMVMMMMRMMMMMIMMMMMMMMMMKMSSKWKHLCFSDWHGHDRFVWWLGASSAKSHYKSLWWHTVFLLYFRNAVILMVYGSLFISGSEWLLISLSIYIYILMRWYLNK